MLSENLQQVEEKIADACKRAKRERSEVTLIAVSKTKPISMLQEIYNEGIRCFGENKVQEMCEKMEILPKDIHWHMIGHLQTNKVKYIIDSVSVSNILIEVNVAEEESKFGVKVEEVLPLIEKIALFPNIQIKGLMTIAPYVKNPEENRPIFRRLRKLSVDINAKNIDNVNVSILSMGMTNDYEVAIEEGATMVRVGTGIFGERNYTTV